MALKSGCRGRKRCEPGTLQRFPFLRRASLLGTEQRIVGGTIAVYLAAKLFWEPHVPTILAALATAVLMAVLSGRVETGSGEATALLPVLATPEVTIASIVTVPL